MLGIVEDELPTELQPLLKDPTFDGDNSLSIDKIEFVENNLVLHFMIFFEVNTNEMQEWRLDMKGLQSHKIDLTNLEGFFKLYSKHPILCEFNETETSLYFNKPPSNPEKLVSDVYAAHKSVFENDIDVEHFLNNELDLVRLSKSTLGLFATGPKNILEIYYKCLEVNGMNPYYLGEYEPKHWNGQNWEHATTPIKLLKLGSCYFTGKEFKFRVTGKRQPRQGMEWFSR